MTRITCVIAALLWSVSALAQGYTTMSWGLDKSVSPYAFGSNINGTWRNLGTVSSGGAWNIPSSNLGFTQSGTGAVAQTVDAKLKLTINLQDFGGNGNNSTPNNTAFSNAIAAVIAAGGGKIIVPAGKYVITAAQSVSDCNAPVYIEGAGTGATIIRQTSGAAGAFVWDCGGDFANGGGLSNMTIEAGAGYETSRFTGTGSSGVGVSVTKMVGQGVFEHLSINNFSYSFVMNGSWDTDIGFVRALFFSGAGLRVGTNTSIPAGGSDRIHHLKLSNNGFTGNNTASVGMQIGATGGEYIDTVEITSSYNGVILAPDTGQSLLYLFMNKVAPDNTTGPEWELNSTKGPIYSIVCVDCWASYGNNVGFVAYGPAANYANVKFTNFRVRENVYAGISIQTTGSDPTGIEFVAPEIASNSRGRPQLSSGVEFYNNVNGIQITGGFIGNGGSLVSDQGYGIYCSGSNSVSVIGTDLTKYGIGTGEYSCGAGNVITQYRQSAIIPGTLTVSGAATFNSTVKLATYAIAALPTCNAGALGSIATVSNGTDYATGTYGSAVSATGAVTRPVVCTNTAGATTYAWAYN